MNPTFSGVRNLDEKESVTLQQDGVSYIFAPGEVKVVSSEVANFAATRVAVKHDRNQDGKPVGIPYGKRLFELVPLHEALKVAHIDENPSIVEAKKKAEEEAAKTRAIVEAVKKQLLDDGWKPPKYTKTEKEGD